MNISWSLKPYHSLLSSLDPPQARLNTIAKSAERSLREQQIQLEEAQQALSEMQNQSIQQTWLVFS